MITLKTLPQATAQEVFNQVVKHLGEQKVPSRTKTSKCSYKIKLDDGTILKCAAGCLFADEEYSPEFENHRWVSLIRDHSIPSNHSRLIQDLQKAHDESARDSLDDYINEIPVRLMDIANEKDLDTSFVNIYFPRIDL